MTQKRGVVTFTAPLIFTSPIVEGGANMKCLWVFETYDYLNFPHTVAVLEQSYDKAVEKLNNAEFEYPFKSYRFLGGYYGNSHELPSIDFYI